MIILHKRLVLLLLWAFLLVVSPLFIFAQEPFLNKEQLELQDSILKEQAWAIPVWENVDSILVKAIKTRLATHPTVTRYSPHLVYFAYYVERATHQPPYSARAVLDTLLSAEIRFQHHFESVQNPYWLRNEGQLLNGIGVYFLRLDRADSAFLYFNKANAVYERGAALISKRAIRDSVEASIYFDTWASCKSNYHLPFLHLVRNESGPVRLQNVNKMLRHLHESDTVVNRAIALNPYDCETRKTKVTILLNIGNVYFQLMRDSTRALEYFNDASRIIESCHLNDLRPSVYNAVSAGYLSQNNLQQSLRYALEGLRESGSNMNKQTSVYQLTQRIAVIYAIQNNFDSLKKYATISLRDTTYYKRNFDTQFYLTTLCKLALQQGRTNDLHMFFPILQRAVTQNQIHDQFTNISEMEAKVTREALYNEYEDLKQHVESGVNWWEHPLNFMLTISLTLTLVGFGTYLYLRNRQQIRE